MRTSVTSTVSCTSCPLLIKKEITWKVTMRTSLKHQLANQNLWCFSKTLLKILLSLSICDPIITLSSGMSEPYIERDNKTLNLWCFSKTLLKILLPLSIWGPIITLSSVMIGLHIERDNKIFNKVLEDMITQFSVQQ